MTLSLNKIQLPVNMYKTCNLSTVQNTPSEARRDTSCVDYYYIDFCGNKDDSSVIASTLLSRVVNVIYDYLDERDIYIIDKMYICARMKDGSIRRMFEIHINSVDRHMRISRVR